MRHVLLAAFAWAAAGIVALPRECPGGRSLELGDWSRALSQLDSTVIEHKPVSQGNIFVYENVFPGHSIRYINVDNVAVRTCGAHASLKSGGVGASSVLVVLVAPPGHEIRAVIDVWGVRDTHLATHTTTHRDMKSTFLFKDVKPTRLTAPRIGRK